MSTETFTREDLEAAVKAELEEVLPLSPEGLSLFVEATLFQLARAIEHRDHVDMDYIGEFRRVQMPDGPVYYRFHPRCAGIRKEVA